MSVGPYFQIRVYNWKSLEMESQVAVLDAGAQYAKMIDRRLRELCVESVLLPLETSAADLKVFRAIIISGGPQSVYDKDAPKYDPNIFLLGVPILGICYGMQLLVHANGGIVEKKVQREDGVFDVKVDTKSTLFHDLADTTSVLLTHGDSVATLPSGFQTTAVSGNIVAAVECAERNQYGLQFHPEVDLSVDGPAIFRNFLFKVCKLSGSFTMASREKTAIHYIRDTVGDKKVLVLVSGGVDSSVCAALLAKAIGADRVVALHIDHGFMRKGESASVTKALEALGLHLEVLDASADFASATTQVGGEKTLELSKTVNPEHKRKIIGDTFMRVTEAMVLKLGLKPEDVYLAQGTLRPDLIESASSLISTNSTVIKTHHNDTQLVRELRERGRIVEPLRDYHKDEVRELGQDLGLPEHLVWRQPFPGPGLAIRLLCTHEPYITDKYVSNANALIGACNSYPHLNLAPALLPVRTVGVQGDGRSYSYLAALSSDVSPDDHWNELFDLAQQIPGKAHNINRIVYVLGPPIKSPPQQVIPTTLTTEAVDILRDADHIVTEILTKYGLLRSLAQVPVVLFPITFDVPGHRSIGIRAFVTRDFMTGKPALPGKDMPFEALGEINRRILAEVKGISRVALDITAKPPATTEWE